MNCIAMRVAIVSANAVCASINILDYGSSILVFERSFWLLLPSISVSVCGRHSQTRGLVLRAAKSKHC